MKEHIDTSTGEVLFSSDMDYELKVWPQQEDCVVIYRSPDGVMCFQFYFRPNWWIRLWMWLGDFEAEWQ